MPARTRFRLAVIAFACLAWRGACPVVAAPQDVPRRVVSGETARAVPAWLRQSVVYEIFPRTFSPEGTLNGVTRRLDDLRRLGIDVLWLMPIHPVGSVKAKGTWGSPYAVRDYFAVNPDYGAPADLRRLVTEAHARGFKVILDMVPNHTAWDSVLMKDPSFYTHRDGRIVPPVDDWADVADLDYANPRLRALMLDVFRYWIEEFDVDGYRCDVAFFVPTDFWEEVRAAVSRVKPDALLIAEAAEPELLVSAFDLDYAWPFHTALTDVLQGRRPATALAETWQLERARYPRGALRMYFSDNHDERRAIARFGEGGALAASAIVFALDGVPMLYNGMDAGDTTESGAPALFERLPVFWQAAERRPQFPRFYQQLIALRRQSPALATGELDWPTISEPDRVVAIRRLAASDEILVIVNVSNRPWAGRVEVAGGAAWREVTPRLDVPAAAAPARADIRFDRLTLDAWGVRILRRVDGDPRP